MRNKQLDKTVSRGVISSDVQFYRYQAERCRGLARLTDELCRQLINMAEEFDDRVSEAESSVEQVRTHTGFSPPSPRKDSVEPLTLSIKDATRLLGLGRSTIYKLIGDGQIETVKIGNRVLLKSASIRKLVEAQDPGS